MRVEPVIEMPAKLEAGTASEGTFLTAIAPESQLHQFRLDRDVTPESVLAPGSALISRRLAEELSVETGDEINIRTPFGLLAAEVSASNEEVISGAAYVDLGWVRSQAGGLELLNGLLLQVDEAERANVRKRLYRVPGVASIDLKEEIIAGWRSIMGLFYVMMGSFLTFALIIAGAVIFNTMTVNVLERQREIATMRALGQSRSRVRRMITQENMLVGLLTLLPALALATGVTYYLFQIFADMSVEFYLPFYLSPWTYVIITALVFGTALVAQIPAVRRVNRMDLAEATKIMA
jgi:putative ABC transport system permease protein